MRKERTEQREGLGRVQAVGSASTEGRATGKAVRENETAKRGPGVEVRGVG